MEQYEFDIGQKHGFGGKTYDAEVKKYREGLKAQEFQKTDYEQKLAAANAAAALPPLVNRTTPAPAAPIPTPELQPGQQNLAQNPKPFSWLMGDDQQVGVGDPKAQSMIDASLVPSKEMMEIGQPAMQQLAVDTLPQTQDALTRPPGREVMLEGDTPSGIFRNGNSYSNVRSDGQPTLESQKSHYAKPDWVTANTPKDAFGNWMRPETVKYVQQRNAERARDAKLGRRYWQPGLGSVPQAAPQVDVTLMPKGPQSLRDFPELPENNIDLISKYRR